MLIVGCEGRTYGRSFFLGVGGFQLQMRDDGPCVNM